MVTGAQALLCWGSPQGLCAKPRTAARTKNTEGGGVHRQPFTRLGVIGCSVNSLMCPGSTAATLAHIVESLFEHVDEFAELDPAANR
jgi:hypothetical protein